MRRVAPRSDLIRRIAPMAAAGLGGAALTIAMTIAAIKYAPPPPAIGPLMTSIQHFVIDLSATAGLRLEELTVEGRTMTPADDLLAALDVARGAPIMTINVAEARAALEALPWVKAAQVERRLPNSVHIVIQERQPYALWQQGARYTLVDREGSPIVQVPAADPSMRLIVGPDAPRHAAALFAELENLPEIAARVRTAVWVGGRRWNIYLDAVEGGIAIRLPEDDIAGALTRLATLERDHKILERDLDFIDLRLADRLIVRMHTDPNAPAAAADKQQVKKKTTPGAVLSAPGPKRTT